MPASKYGPLIIVKTLVGNGTSMKVPNWDICKEPPKAFITLYKKARNPLPGEPGSKVTPPFINVSNAVKGDIK